MARKKSSLPSNFSSNKVDAENIYEEIEDVKAQHSASSSINNSDSGIGGLNGNAILNSYGSSSASKSSSGGSTGNGNGSASKGTLDVSRPRHKKSSNSEQGKSAMAAAAERAKRKQESGIPLSSLDALISQTSPGLTAHQRLSLRKSLVDELFEELIQRHHRRVLDELRLDVEEFIAPSPDSIDLPANLAENSSNNVTPKSSRSSAQSCSKLHRCESMDFKDSQNNFKKNNVQVENNSSNNAGRNAEQNKKIGSKLWQSARKCTEVIQRKLKKSSLEQQQQNSQQTQQPQLGANSVSATRLSGPISSPSSGTKSKPSISGPNLPPPVPPHQHLVSGASALNQSQVTRRGHRPLSAIVTTSNNNNHSKKISNSVNKEPVIDTLEDDLSDNEQDAADRRLLRSKIIKSFWEQHDQEGGDFSEAETSDKR